MLGSRRLTSCSCRSKGFLVLWELHFPPWVGGFQNLGGADSEEVGATASASLSACGSCVVLYSLEKGMSDAGISDPLTASSRQTSCPAGEAGAQADGDTLLLTALPEPPRVAGRATQQAPVINHSFCSQRQGNRLSPNVRLFGQIPD